MFYYYYDWTYLLVLIGVVICMAASASFSTPIGYQTNLIVQGVGGYKFTDFVKVGLPLNLITFLISVFVIPMIWKF